ncbi:MAG: FG-GAP-like repeat-containing protein [Candidatus Thermoplasmatota archaeon]|nr:FG-GAP-like repeat-containing protein [Candidatus Thermoplasmatota archaeon]
MGSCPRLIGNQARLERSFALAVFGLLLGTALLTIPSTHSSGMSDGTSTRATDDVSVNWNPVTSGLPTDREYYGVYFGDVNNDGRLDVAAQGGGTHVYVGDGQGNFIEQSSGLPGAGGDVDLILADFNNDGNLDVVGNQVFMGNGGEGGSMVWTPDLTPGGWNALTAADVNLDGNMDLIAGTPAGVRVWAGDGGVGGSMVWTDSSVGLPNSGNFWGVAIGDVNGDGKPDIVTADNLNGIKAWTGNGLPGAALNWTDAYTGTDLPTTGMYSSVDLGDVDNDGDLDIAATAYYTPQGVRVWLGNGGTGGSMTWTDNSTGLDTVTDRYLAVSLQDLDNDGDLDIFASHYQGAGLRIWLGDGGAGGSMTWTEESTGLPSGNFVDIDAGDYNNDGKIDFVTSYNGGVEIWENERPDLLITGYTEISTGLPASLRWADVVFEDVNRDGKLDVGFTSFQNEMRGLRVFLGDGSGSWVNSSSGLSMTGGYGGLRFDDLNHDGAQDIVAAGLNGFVGLDVWSGNGSGAWTQEGSASSDFGGGIEKGDLNNDGNTDIVTGFYTGNSGPMVFLGDGNFSWSPDEGPPASTMSVDDAAIGDVNHDGKMDFTASSMDSVGVQVWTGNGSGLADSWIRNDTGLPTVGVYLGLAFGDVNHDGNLDLAAARYAALKGMFVFTGNGGSGGSMLWEGNSSGLPTTGEYGGAELCDLDLDGNLDLVFAGSGSGAEGVTVRMGNGGAGGVLSWSDPSLTGLPTTGEYWGIACGDVNNDGLLEIGAAGDGGVEVWTPILQGPSSPIVTLSVPDGAQDWSGNSVHDIIWNMSDLQDANTLLTVYINYSFNAGTTTGTIAGPIAGGPNPNVYSWTTPFLNATDVAVNVTAIDTDAYTAWAEAFVPIVDSTPPAVLSTIPVDGSTDVSRSATVQASWSEGMNASSTETAFSLLDNSTWTAVPGQTSWIGDTIVFTPDSLLDTNRSYTANFTAVASDDSDPGNNLVSPYSWSFRATVNADTFPPEIGEVSAQPSPQEVYNNVNVSANVTDDFGLQSVVVNITQPDMSWSNTSLNPAGGDYYYLNMTYNELGDYSFMIWASDVYENWNSSSGTFRIVDTTPPDFTHAPPGTWRVEETSSLSVTVIDNFLLQSVRVNYTDTDGVVHNESMSLLGGDEFNYVVEAQSNAGMLTYFFWANDSDGNGARSQAYDAEITETRPLPPENLTVTPEDRRVLFLRWDPPTENEDGSPLTGRREFNIYRMTESGGLRFQLNTERLYSTAFYDEDLGDGRTYYYVVTAVNKRGLESDYSDEASGTTTKTQTEDYTWLILLVILIVIIVVTLSILLMRRRKESFEEAGEEAPPSEDETQSEQM